MSIINLFGLAIIMDYTDISRVATFHADTCVTSHQSLINNNLSFVICFKYLTYNLYWNNSNAYFFHKLERYKEHTVNPKPNKESTAASLRI